MKPTRNPLPAETLPHSLQHLAALLLFLILLSACGGGSSGSAPAAPPIAATCVPGDASTASECGTLLLGLTDADGDFLSYTVDVVSLTLEKASGVTVEVLPVSTRIDFASYVDLTELVTTSLIPPGVYVAGTITLDYSAAEIFVEASGDAKAATAVDANGQALGQAEFRIELSDRDHLVITRGRPSLLTVDFDLAASHRVDIAATPALAFAEPFIVAEIEPADSKDIRLRGAFIEADETAMQYTVAVRPFHDRDGDFGRIAVNITDDTEFEVNGDSATGIEGLRALEAAGPGTLTVAQGILDVPDREFTANVVLAGSSVPGADADGVHGSVIARSGNELTVRGATYIPENGAAFFHDDVVVTVGPDTKVSKRGSPGMTFDIDDISIGSRISVRGVASDITGETIAVDATEGAVRLHLTHLLGTVNSVNPGQVDIDLHAIDRRRVGIFDFAGTGASTDVDADPENYEVMTGNLDISGQAADKPVVVYGFPSDFGAAPPDFEGRTLVDYSDVRSALGVGWGMDGTTAPFLSMGSDGLLLDNDNPAIDQRHYIKQGPVLIDLTTLDSSTLIAPRETGRAVFCIATRDRLRVYTDFDDFVDALGIALDGATAARSMYARGLYDADSNVFTAWKIGVYLLEP
jgi:hypothetical protein